MAEWQDRERLSYAPTFAMVERWRRFEYNSGRFAGFDACKDLFRDGTVIALPTPGHSLGHSAVLVSLGDHFALITGDAAYTMRHLDPRAVASFAVLGEQALTTYEDSVRRMVALQEELGDVVFIAPHDPFEYNTVVLARALEDGRLAAKEREELRARQAALYHEDGTLRDEAMPRWDDDVGLVVDIP
jgi:glyoxylase-like metal-dependent hydrolase (beta-lactamase superfamily II)